MSDPEKTTESEASPAGVEQGVTEDYALSLLRNRDLSAQAVETIAKTSSLLKSRKVRMALAEHPRVARRVALRLLRESYTFDLMQFAMSPGAAADLKRVADDLLISRLASISFGERISLARRGSGLVAGALLLDKESRVWQPALENPRITEAAIVKALQRGTVSVAFVEAVSHHRKWSVRSEIRVALLRSPHTPMARALEFARRLRKGQLRDILHTSRLPEKIKAYLRRELDAS